MARRIVLRSSNDVTFEVDEAVALESPTIRDMIERDVADGGSFPLNVTSDILAMVIEYCNRHVGAANPEEIAEDLRAWDAEFVRVDHSVLRALILAANYLNIRSLLDLTTQAAADVIRGMTPEEIRRFFNIEENLTPAEEEEFRRDNRWAFD